MNPPLRKLLCLGLALLWVQAGTARDTEPPARESTATDNVEVLTHPLTMEALGRERRIRLYLPPGYEHGTERYPVLYMHDGQNLFDAATSYAGEWGVDEALNALAESDGLSLIVVGIDNGGEDRVRELNAYANEELGEPEGEAYLAFIMDTVKPWIDERYRTRTDRKNTAIMGSSLGGLITHYAIFEHGDVFSKAGIFSPSYWVSDEVFELSNAADLAPDTRLYFQVGEREKEMVPGMLRMVEQLREQGLHGDNLKVEVTRDGEHNEATWRERFPDAVRWLFNDA